MFARPSLVIRADADTAIGTGHVMRCLALAQAWQDGGGSVSFVSTRLPEAIAARLRDEEMEVAVPARDDAADTAAMARARAAAWIVVDGYGFGPPYHRALQAAGFPVLQVDDCGGNDRYCVDRVLNPNPYAEPGLYAQRTPGTQLLLGLNYALVRREFRELPARARAGDGQRVLVVFGGSDATNRSGIVLRALAGEAGLELRIVVGPANPHLDALRQAAAGARAVIEIITAADMPALLTWADAAVSAAGSTCWELLHAGLPMAVTAVADNQRGVAAWLLREGLALPLAGAGKKIGAVVRQLLQDKRRRAAAERGRRLVDGHGAARVVAALGLQPIRLRPAQPEDCALVFRWANDPAVRAASFTSATITWAEHVPWFGARLSDGNCRYWIAETVEGEAIGQVRFEIADADATVSISLDAAHRGRGTGTQLIRVATRQMATRPAIARVHAYVKPTNEASARAFLAAGYAAAGDTVVRHQPALHFVWSRVRMAGAKVP